MYELRHLNAVVLTAGVLLVVLPTLSHAFGAGNIASIAQVEGQNWRHGDIEDTLLNILMSRVAGGKKFSKMDVKRVYFGNWLRDYSQAVDVGTVKYVSAEAIRILLWVLGFMSFGYGTKEFEVTHDRLGCYRPEEHIDNPKDYADNIDARQYDSRLRGPVNEEVELAIDGQTGLKNYIASENLGITTSAGLVRQLFTKSIQLGRQYGKTENKADLYEALRLLGTGCHCLEDYSAHSNYTELALIEIGERGVFPHVGRNTQMQLPGVNQPVYPIVTGTFGGVDFLHSVMGELSDKTTQSEVKEVETTMQGTQGKKNSSAVKSLLEKLPSGLFGGQDETSKVDQLEANSAAAQMDGIKITPKEPEEFTRQVDSLCEKIRPIMEFHDETMQAISEFIEKIPILPDLIDNVSDEISIYVFSLLAPFVLPLIQQMKDALSYGSSEVIKSSVDKQLIVFKDDNSTDPTHSMLSKDHFSNVLNEPAGRVASQTLKWVVPQLMACWDDDNMDINTTINRILDGVFHHPAQKHMSHVDGAVEGRQLMFQVVQDWWSSKNDTERGVLRNQLSRPGVETGRNHKPGVHDSGHGSCKPLGLPNFETSMSSGAGGGPLASALLSGIGSGAIGGMIGGLAGNIGSEVFGDDPLGGDSGDEHDGPDGRGRGRGGGRGLGRGRGRGGEGRGQGMRGRGGPDGLGRGRGRGRGGPDGPGRGGFEGRGRGGPDGPGRGGRGRGGPGMQGEPMRIFPGPNEPPAHHNEGFLPGPHQGFPGPQHGFPGPAGPHHEGHPAPEAPFQYMPGPHPGHPNQHPGFPGRGMFGGLFGGGGGGGGRGGMGGMGRGRGGGGLGRGGGRGGGGGGGGGRGMGMGGGRGGGLGGGRGGGGRHHRG